MKKLDTIVAELENVVKYGMHMSPEDVGKLVEKLKNVPPEDGTERLGQTYRLCGDSHFLAVCTAMEVRVGGERHFKLEWRYGRGFGDRWFTEAELCAFDKLEEA